jgi:hypothetical protein
LSNRQKIDSICSIGPAPFFFPDASFLSQIWIGFRMDYFSSTMRRRVMTAAFILMFVESSLKISRDARIDAAIFAL